MERIAMSQEERDELHWLRKAKDGSISQREAAKRIGVSDRWVRKLLKRMLKEGDEVVVHGLRGRPSNRKLAEKTQRQALAILKQPEWHDFGPSFAAEQLRKRHQIQVGKETLRKWMIEAGMWQSKPQRLGEVCMAAAAERVWGIGPVGHLRTRLAGRKRAGALPGADDRRCHQPQRGTLRTARRNAQWTQQPRRRNDQSHLQEETTPLFSTVHAMPLSGRTGVGPPLLSSGEQRP